MNTNDQINTHESFGAIRISRGQGTPTTLFGSSVKYAGTRPFKQTAYSVLDISENNSDNLNDVINSTIFDIDYYEKNSNNKTLTHFDMHTIPSYANGSFKLENKLSDENCFKLEYSTFNLIDPNLKCTTYNPAEVLKNDKLF